MTDLKEQLDERFRQLNWLMGWKARRGHGGRPGPAGDPHRGQGRILAMLKLHDGIATKDLSYLLGIRTSSLNEALARMEKADLITREPSTEDRRIILVSLTEKGRATDQQPTLSNMYAALSESDQQNLLHYLDLLIEALEAELGPEAKERLQRMLETRERFAEEDFEPRLHRPHHRGPRGPRGFGGPGPRDPRCFRGPGPRGPEGDDFGPMPPEPADFGPENPEFHNYED
jgi:DNA-binding MarR family transcriptional regulator